MRRAGPVFGPQVFIVPHVHSVLDGKYVTRGDVMTISLTGLLFGFFFFGCVAQFVVLWRVETVLKQRHPQVWLEIEENSAFTSRAVSSFIFRRRDRALNDSVLSRTVSRAAWFYYLMYAIWGVFALSILTGFGRMHLDFSGWTPSIR